MFETRCLIDCGALGFGYQAWCIVLVILEGISFVKMTNVILIRWILDRTLRCFVSSMLLDLGADLYNTCTLIGSYVISSCVCFTYQTQNSFLFSKSFPRWEHVLRADSPQIQGRLSNDGCQGWSRARTCEDPNVPWALKRQVPVTATVDDLKGSWMVCLLSIYVYTLEIHVQESPW